MLKRYHKGLEQALVILPQGAAVAQAGHAVRERAASCRLGAVDQPAAAVPDRLPSGFGVAVACRHQHGAAAHGHLLQDPEGLPGQRGSRCAQLSRASTCRVSARRRRGSAAAMSRTCRWAPTPGTATRTRSCPARRPAARCDQGANPARVIPAPSVNNGLNPVPADQLPPRGAPAPVSDPLTPPGQGTVSAVDNNPTRVRTLRHQGHPTARSTARPAVRWSDPTASGTTSAIRVTQETTDGRRCWHPPAEPHRC